MLSQTQDRYRAAGQAHARETYTKPSALLPTFRVRKKSRLVPAACYCRLIERVGILRGKLKLSRSIRTKMWPFIPQLKLSDPIFDKRRASGLLIWLFPVQPS